MLPVIKKRAYVPGLSDPFFGTDMFSTFFNDGADYAIPAVNIREADKSFEIEMAVPGLNKDEIRIKLEKDTLTVSSEKKPEMKSEESEHFMRKEFSIRTFSRSFSVPESVDTDALSASHANGVLKISLPKREKGEAQKNRTIKIS